MLCWDWVISEQLYQESFRLLTATPTRILRFGCQGFVGGYRDRIWFPRDPRCDDALTLFSDNRLLQPESQTLRWGSQIILRVQKQAAVFVFRVLDYGECHAWSTHEGNRADEAMKGLRRVGRAALAEMRHGQDSNSLSLRHGAQWLKHPSHLGVLMRIRFAQVGANRVYRDQLNIANLINLLFQQFDVGLKAKSSTGLEVHSHCANYVNSTKVSLSGKEFEARWCPSRHPRR